jgi:hypothetical protein
MRSIVKPWSLSALVIAIAACAAPEPSPSSATPLAFCKTAIQVIANNDLDGGVRLFQNPAQPRTAEEIEKVKAFVQTLGGAVRLISGGSAVSYRESLTVPAQGEFVATIEQWRSLTGKDAFIGCALRPEPGGHGLMSLRVDQDRSRLMSELIEYMKQNSPKPPTQGI